MAQSCAPAAVGAAARSCEQGIRVHEHVYHAATCLPSFLRAFPDLYPSLPNHRMDADPSVEAERRARIRRTLAPILRAIASVCVQDASFVPAPLGMPYFIAEEPSNPLLTHACMLAKRELIDRDPVRRSLFLWKCPRFASHSCHRRCNLRKYLMIRLKPCTWELSHRIQLWALKGMPSAEVLSSASHCAGPRGRLGLPLTLHACGKPSCQQPRHLAWGTTKDNLKGPTNRNRCKGKWKHGCKERKESEKTAALARIEAE